MTRNITIPVTLIQFKLVLWVLCPFIVLFGFNGLESLRDESSGLFFLLYVFSLVLGSAFFLGLCPSLLFDLYKSGKFPSFSFKKQR